MAEVSKVEKPTTPKSKDDSGSEDRDTFEDATDITPRPRTQSSSRSLTGGDKRPGSAASTATGNSVGGLGIRDSSLTARGTPDIKEEAEETKKENIYSEASMGRTGSGLSNTEGLDEINLGNGSHTRASAASISSIKAPPINIARTVSHDSNTSSVTSPDRTPASSITISAANMARNFKSPFSWLNRSSTNQKLSGAVSPGNEKRKSDPESLNSVNRASQSSLKDRFKAVRLREEAGIVTVGDDMVADGVPGSAGSREKAEPSVAENGSLHRDSLGSPTSPVVNTQLAPGTAAGIAEGPQPTDAPPVDWDLWQAVVTEGPAAVSRTSPEELTNAIAAGIPQAIRGVIWQVLADSKNEGMERLYHDLVARGTEKEAAFAAQTNGSPLESTNGSIKDKESIASSASSVHSAAAGESGDGFTNPQAPKPKSAKEEHAHIQVLEKTIRRDLGTRTSYSKYLMSPGLQEGLFGVCKAYALYDEDVGYAQGMNFIAMPLLFNMPEAEAFCLFVRIMSKYGMRDMFTAEMPGLHLHLYQFERLLEDHEPALFCHLNRRGVTPNLYATQWFLTLFAYRFPLQLVQRIYDLILSSSLEISILKFALVLMQKNKDTLLAMRDMSHISQFLKERLFDVYIDKQPNSASILESGFFGASTSGVDKEVYKADQLVRDATSIDITEETLKLYTAEWNEKQRVEKERDAELETLRTQGASLTIKVRRLEERVQKSDGEHVQLASELVRLKVANESMLYQNESLRGQVDELKAVVSRQTEEVEARLKGEMDEVMRRNSEVHNANRALDEEKAEMEKLLVETKMLYAQVNSEHETLKQRWNSVVQMMK